MTDPSGCNHWELIKRHFEAAQSLSDEQLEAYIAKQADLDPSLCNELKALIRAHRDTVPFTTPFWNPVLIHDQSMYTPGDRIGKYEVIERIGSGGMGEVYKAKRLDHYETHVAIKVVREHVATPTMIERFQAERQTLATLNHPNIISIFDGGTTASGMPFIVMELLEGSSVTTHCNEAQLSLKDMLSLFCTVCEAVQCAHQSFVVHGDLKPSNVMVDKNGDIKLLDFGIALDSSSHDLGTNTHAADHANAFTIGCASPEQATGGSITAATDVYSLGLMLYELLTGVRAYSVSGMSRSEATQCITELEPPLASASMRMNKDQSRFSEACVSGELDAIVQRAIQKDPADRYQSAQHLADDLRRHLECKPIHAYPRTRKYTALKCIQRNKSASIFAGIGLLFASIAVASISAGYVQARIANAESQRQRQRDNAQDTVEFLETILAQASPFGKDRPMSVEQALRNSDQMIRTELSEHPEVAANVHLAVGRIYMDLFLFDKAVPHLQDAYTHFEHAQHPVEPTTYADCVSMLARAKSDLVWTLEINSQDVVHLQEQVLSLRKEQYTSPHPLIAETLGDLALAHWAQDPHKPASDLVLELYLQSMAMFTQLGMEKSPLCAEVHVGIAHTYSSRFENSLAEMHFSHGVEIYSQSTEVATPFSLKAQNAYARILSRIGKKDQALDWFNRSIEQSPMHWVVRAEVEARWGRLFELLDADPRSDQNQTLLDTIGRQTKLYLQASPNDESLINLLNLLESASATDTADLFDSAIPVFIEQQRQFPVSLPEHLHTFTQASVIMFGKDWTLAMLYSYLAEYSSTNPTDQQVPAVLRSLISQVQAILPIPGPSNGDS
tara:strand:+ start:59948 stop:62476 length:2529 start_codon:yes stop_codon:yes gene_type:complete